MHSNTPIPDADLIDVRELSRRFDARPALESVTLRVPRGVAFGLVGENGAGKTTLIRHWLGLLKAQTGSVRVFGVDPTDDPAGVLGRVGYLSEERDLPGWMRVAELMRFTRAFYPRWDAVYAERWREEFRLRPHARVKELSRGELAKLGLLLALAHRPELLVLDEPSSGLDPIVRRDILEAVIRTIAEEGRTVVFSSHLLDEVERVSDRLAMMHRGRIVLCGSLDEIKAGHHRLTVRFEEAQVRPPSLPGALGVSGEGKDWTLICNGARDELIRDVQARGARVLEEQTPSLDEIFVARAGQSPVNP